MSQCNHIFAVIYNVYVVIQLFRPVNLSVSLFWCQEHFYCTMSEFHYRLLRESVARAFFTEDIVTWTNTGVNNEVNDGRISFSSFALKFPILWLLAQCHTVMVHWETWTEQNPFFQNIHFKNVNWLQHRPLFPCTFNKSVTPSICQFTFLNGKMKSEHKVNKYIF